MKLVCVRLPLFAFLDRFGGNVLMGTCKLAHEQQRKCETKRQRICGVERGQKDFGLCPIFPAEGVF